MMQQQTSIPTALQALMVLRQQASPTAPGPGGQPIPTVAAQTAQQMMPPQPQQGGLPSIAQNTATGNAIEMQRQQDAQRQMMDQMMQAQQAQQQQPVMAAEGGIASLDVGGMDDFAEGGVVGYNGTEDSFVDRLPEGSGLRKFLELMQRQEDFNRLVEAQQLPLEPVPATLGAQAPTGGGLTTEAARGQAPKDQARAAPAPVAPASRVSASGIASGRGANIPSIQQLINEALAPMTAAAAGYTAPKQLTPQEIEELDLAELRRKGLPEQEKAAEEQGLAELRRQNAAIREFQRQMLAKKEAALGTPGEQAMNRFMEAVRYGAQGGKGSFAQGLQNAILAERQGAEARDAERLKMLEAGKAEAIEYTRIQALIDEARRAKAFGRVEEAQKLEEAARQAANDIVKMRVEGAKGAIPSAISAYGGMRQQQMQDARAERLASLRGETDADTKKLLAYARVQQAINSDPKLKKLADLAALDPAGPQAAEYKRAVEELTLKLAPELLISAGGGTSGGSGAMAAADAILKGSQ